MFLGVFLYDFSDTGNKSVKCLNVIPVILSCPSDDTLVHAGSPLEQPVAGGNV